MPPSVHPLRDQGTLWKRNKKEYMTQRVWGIPRKQGPLNQYDQNSHELTETEVGGIGPAQVCTRFSTHILWLPVECFHGIPKCVNE